MKLMAHLIFQTATRKLDALVFGDSQEEVNERMAGFLQDGYKYIGIFTVELKAGKDMLPGEMEVEV